MFTYIIVLSNEGDLLLDNGNGSWKSTQDFQKATKFETREDARNFLLDNSIKFIWSDAKTEAVSI